MTREPTTLIRMADRIARGALGAAEAVGIALERIEACAAHCAFVEVHRREAAARAAALDEAFRHAGVTGPLHGVPLAIKDNIDQAGTVCSAGSRAYDDRIPVEDAPVVSALIAAGAVIVGRTNMNELADGVTGENPHFGDVHNPRRAGYRAGGSSAGSAAAVADGSVAGALGTDTGGSVRIPAALCGVVGFKPSADLLPTRGVLPLSTTLDHVGVIARDAGDAATLMDALAAGGTFAPAVVPGDVLRGARIGVLEGFADEAEPGVAALFEQALGALERAGAEPVPVRVPELAGSLGLLARIYGPEAAQIHGDRLDRRPGDMGDVVRRDLARGRGEKARAGRVEALEGRRAVAAALAQAGAGIPFLVSPTTPMPATPHGAPDPHRYLAFTCAFNLTGQPALSVPMGEVAGLPAGLQIVGAVGADRAVLELGIAFEGLDG